MLDFFSNTDDGTIKFLGDYQTTFFQALKAPSSTIKVQFPTIKEGMHYLQSIVCERTLKIPVRGCRLIKSLTIFSIMVLKCPSFVRKKYVKMNKKDFLSKFFEFYVIAVSYSTLLDVSHILKSKVVR